MSKQVKADESHLANAGILRHLKSFSQELPRWAPTYLFDRYELMASPDIEDQLSLLGKSLPEPCGGMCYGSPVLVYPNGGIVFAAGIGGSSIILRLPELVRSDALASGARNEVHFGGQLGYPKETLLATEVGPDWVFIGAWLSHEDLLKRKQWLRLAYEYAGELALVMGV